MLDNKIDRIKHWQSKDTGLFLIDFKLIVSRKIEVEFLLEVGFPKIRGRHRLCDHVDRPDSFRLNKEAPSLIPCEEIA